MSYNSVAQLPASEKYTLAWIEPSQRLNLWTIVSGAIYSRSVSHLVTNVSENGTNLTEATSATLSSGEWYFSNKTLYVRASDDSNPQTKFISATYRIFFSDKPISLPYDLDNGHDVYYDSLIKSVSNFPIGLDAEQIGQAIESSGTISFFNDNDFFIDNFDRLIWENKNIKIFSYLDGINPSESKTLFQGEITGKTFSSSQITFTVKDPLHKLRQKVSSALYTAADGNIGSDIIGKPKRIIFGKVDGLRLQSLDQVLSGYTLTGTISVTLDSTSLVGSSTLFLKELSPEDEITLTNEFGTEFSYRVESITDNTNAVLTEEVEESISGATATVEPDVPYRYKNRIFQVAGHKLRQPTTTLSENAVQLNRIVVTDSSDFLVGDLISVGSETATIKRISGNNLVLTQNLDAIPLSGTSVIKKPVTAVYFDTKKMVIDRDYTITTNTATNSIITLEDDAELNITIPRKLNGTISFTNASRDVTGVSSEFTAQLKPRDWIISSDINHQTWYEVLDVTDDTNLILRIAYAGSNTSGTSKRKEINYISDDSVVTCDTIGKESAIDGSWVKTASDSVKELLYLAGITNINTASFIASDTEAPYIVSLRLPLEVGGDMPEIKTAISYINTSVFGSLVNRSNFQLAYNILSPNRPQLTEATIGDDDKINFSVKTKVDTYRKIVGKYRHQDNERYSGELSNSTYSFENDFVDYLVGTEKELEKDIYLYNTNDATAITQRIAYFHSLSQSVISIVGGGLSLSNKELNDKVYVKLSKLYKRFGGDDLAKVVIINSIKRNGKNFDIECNDLGNWFNRTAAICDDSTSDFTSATDQEKILSGFIVDDSTELCGSTEISANTNLIG